HQLELAHLARWLLVHLDDLADLRDREPETLAAKDLTNQMTVGRTEQTGPSASYRRNEPLVLVEAKGPRRHVEFPCQLGDGVIFTHFACPAARACLPRHLRKSQTPLLEEYP